jgi:hypothetical protein
MLVDTLGAMKFSRSTIQVFRFRHWLSMLNLSIMNVSADVLNCLHMTRNNASGYLGRDS